MEETLFTADFKAAPYWLDDAGLPTLDAPDALPARADVAVVGAGYTGLVAALTLARAGRRVVVFEAGEIGAGCSSRNGGQCGAGLKPGLDGLTARYGAARARALYEEAMASLEFLAAFIAAEKIECDFHRPGRFIGAHAPGKYETLARDLERLNRELGIAAHAVPRAEQRTEIGSDIYFGGGVIENHAALHPARYLAGLLARATAAGVTVIAHTPVTAIARDGDGFTLKTPRGPVTAGEVVVATNGYSNRERALPAFRRRVIPIGSYMIATEPLPEDLVTRLCPKDRVLNDTRKVVLYFRPSPDRRRIVFGGRVALAETDPLVGAPRLHAIMSTIFPELKTARVSHAWMGFVAFTFDHLPHVGARDGLHYAMGYCGSGVAMATHLGHKLALKILGRDEGRTAFDARAFTSRPLYDGHPWFLAGAVLYYRLRDRLAR